MWRILFSGGAMLYSDLGIVALACEKALTGERGLLVTGHVARKSFRFAPSQLVSKLCRPIAGVNLPLDTNQRSHFAPLKKCIYRS